MAQRLRIHIRVRQPGVAPSEWTFDHPDMVTIGYSSKASVLLLDPSAEPSAQIFEIRHGELCLIVDKNLDGNVNLDGKRLSLQSLKKVGLLRKYGKQEYVALTPLTEGDFTLGTTEVRFWVTELGKEDDFPTTPWFRKVLDGFPKLFILAILFSAGTHYFLMNYLLQLPAPPPPTVAEIKNRVTRISVSQRDQMTQEYKRMEKRLARSRREGARAQRPRRAPLPKASAGFLKAVRKRTGTAEASPFEKLFTTESLSEDLQGLVNSESMRKLVDKALASEGPGGSGETSQNTIDVGPVGSQNLASGPLEKSTSGPTVARMSMADPGIQGSLNRRKVENLIADRSESIRECYELARARKPRLSGKLTVKIIVGEAGRVSRATVDRSTVNDRGLERCVLTQVRKWPFPKPEGGPTTVLLPLIFASGRPG